MAEGRGIRKVVVGVDGSQHAAHAVQWAVRMAKAMGSEVIAVFVVTPPVYFDAGYGMPNVPIQYDKEWRQEMKKELDETWCKPLAEAGVTYRTVMDDGRAASVIISIAEAEDADLVLVGRRGRGGMAELLLGSVSHELVLHCKRPVLVISSAPR